MHPKLDYSELTNTVYIVFGNNHHKKIDVTEQFNRLRTILIPLKQEPTILIHDSKNPEGRPMTKNEQLKFNGRDEYMSIGTKPNEYVSFGSIPKGEVKSYIVKEPQYHFERWVDGDRVFYSNGHTTSEHALADDPIYGDGYVILDRDTQKLYIFKDCKLVELGEPGNEAKKDGRLKIYLVQTKQLLIVGCFSTEDKAKKYAGNGDVMIQEVEVF